MKSTIATNLYRLSLVLVLGVFLYGCIDTIVHNGKWTEDAALNSGVTSLFIVLIAGLLRVIAFFMRANVKWWDFFAYIIIMMVGDFFSYLTYGTSWGAIWPAIIALFPAFLLVRTFRSPV